MNNKQTMKNNMQKDNGILKTQIVTRRALFLSCSGLVFPLLALLCALPVISSCVSSSAYKVPGIEYPPTSASNVTVYYQEPTRQYELIGRVSLVRGAAASNEAAVDKFKEVAAKMGADAVIIDQMPATMGVLADVQGQGRAVKWKTP